MTTIGASTPVSAAAGAKSAAAAPSDREKLKQASKQFEAIFIRQMLASARKTNFDDSGLFSGEGTDTFRQMQDDRFAEIASQSGAFGLAATIENQLARTLPQETK